MDLPVKLIEHDLNQFQKEGKSLCITSSFQTHSLPLLHIMAKVIPNIPVLFIDTGFHFPETYAFVNKIVDEWKLNLISVSSPIPKNQQRDKSGTFFYNSKPNYCCYINKVQPLNDEIKKYDVWVAGLRKEQTAFRKNIAKTTLRTNGQLKYHPIIDWNSKMIYEYRQANHLPEHPLEEQGYFSIGCMPCTTPITEGAERTGRWFGRNKTECGIHLNNN